MVISLHTCEPIIDVTNMAAVTDISLVESRVTYRYVIIADCKVQIGLVRCCAYLRYFVHRDFLNRNISTI